MLLTATTLAMTPACASQVYGYRGDSSREAARHASQVGYRDGIEQGRDDARDHSRYDPSRARRYREGDHDYHDRYGSRDEYTREYRTAFQHGYDEGYRGARR